MESMQMNKKYSDCHPKGKPGVRFPLADVPVDPYNVGARRTHIEAFLRHMELYDEKTLAEAKAESIAILSLRLHQEGLERVGTPFFEFLVDVGVWMFFFKGENPSPIWPWNVPPPRQDDLAQGASPLYAAWLKDEAKKEASKKPEAPNDPATTVAQPTEQAVAAHAAEASIASTSTLPSAPETETETTTAPPARVLPPAQGLSSSRWADEMEIDDDPPALPHTVTLSPKVTEQNRGELLAPKEPSRSKRLDIWRALNRSDLFVAPVCGPFEVLLPEWLDFNALVWGPKGADFAYMHKELIDEDLVITWATTNKGVPSKLIVGFRDGKVGSHIPLCKMDRLGLLFTRVTNWAVDAYAGNPKSLASSLGVARVLDNESMYEPFKPRGSLSKAWQDIKESMHHAHRRAGDASAFKEKLAPQVVEILKTCNPAQNIKTWALGQRATSRFRIMLATLIWQELGDDKAKLAAYNWSREANASLANNTGASQ
ncbi:hypothetical protein NCS52_01004900 [Fusarium sp. LHS14.1]|nr:hypothetical protein NCS52_01004900 [Fusarium sp. LHS14.1]